MNVLIVYAHPEPRSLNGALRDFALDRLSSAGHAVQLSDLYAMRWKAAVDAADFPDWNLNVPLQVEAASKQAYKTGTQPLEVETEQQKLLWADAVIFQFPLWWFSMPAILKGWVDRVYAYGFGYGVGEHSLQKWGNRYGEGTLAGKRAMLVVTAGGWESHYSDRGINGKIEDLLFPINHGILHYPGFDVLPPFILYQTGHLDEARFRQARHELGARLDTLQTTPPIPYRLQNGGDYDIPALVLKSGLSPQSGGFRIHQVIP